MGADSRLRLVDRSVATLLIGGAFTLYAMTLAPTVLAGDGGEFQFVPYLLGVAHPTGYPLYCLLGWVWAHLLWFGDVAYRMNLFSAFWAALAVGLLYRVSCVLLKQTFPQLSAVAHRLLAALAAVTFAVTPTFWSQAIIAEVYSLHLFLLLLILLLLLTLRTEPQPADTQATGEPGARHLLLAACCLGLGFCHHRATVLLVPGILGYLWMVGRRFFRDWRLVFRILLLVLLPLCLYLYIPLRAPGTPYLRLPLDGVRELVLYENTAAGFLDFVLGGPFGGSIDLSVDLVARLSMAWAFVRDEIGGIGLVLTGCGVAWLSIRRHWPLLVLTGLSLILVVGFNLVYTIGDVHVLYIPAYVVLVLWLAVGAAALIQVLSRAWTEVSGGRLRWLPAESGQDWLLTLLPLLVVILLLVPPLRAAAADYAELDQSRNTQDRERWERILAEPLPAEGILVSNDRDDIMPLWYLQYVGNGQRLGTSLLGLYPLITPELPTLGHILDLALGTGRPVYLIKEMPGVEVKVDVADEGELWQVRGLAAGAEPSHWRNGDLAGIMALSGYDQTPRRPNPGDSLSVSLYWETLQPLEEDYHSFVHLLDSAGEKVAQSDHQPGGVYYGSSLWRPGERLRDDHALIIPPDSSGVYRLLAGMYALTGEGDLTPLDAPVDLGRVVVKTSVNTQTGPISHPVTAGFGPFEILGYDAVPREGGLLVRLHWRCISPPDVDYTVFVHLQDGDGNRVAQHDGQPQGGAYPTSAWEAGEVVHDEHVLSLPSDLRPGDYRLQVGLYRLESGERLPVERLGDSATICGPGCIELGPVKLGY